jgi:hypothetical protein
MRPALVGQQSSKIGLGHGVAERCGFAIERQGLVEPALFMERRRARADLVASAMASAAATKTRFT